MEILLRRVFSRRISVYPHRVLILPAYAQRHYSYLFEYGFAVCACVLRVKASDARWEISEIVETVIRSGARNLRPTLLTNHADGLMLRRNAL